MALKDWKKVGVNKWKNSRDNLTFAEKMYSTIKINDLKVPSNWFGSKFIKNYRVSIGNLRGNIENRAEYFKTKSQALKFAKEYMRKH